MDIRSVIRLIEAAERNHEDSTEEFCELLLDWWSGLTGARVQSGLLRLREVARPYATVYSAHLYRAFSPSPQHISEMERAGAVQTVARPTTPLASWSTSAEEALRYVTFQGDQAVAGDGRTYWIIRKPTGTLEVLLNVQMFVEEHGHDDNPLRSVRSDEVFDEVIVAMPPKLHVDRTEVVMTYPH